MKWLALLLLTPLLAPAHDVPDEARIQAFIKPEGKKLRIFVRVPLDSMIDILFPTQEPTAFLDLDRTEQYAAEGARTWVADLLEIYEGDKLLPRPRIVATRLSRKSDPAIASYYPNYNAAEKAVMSPKLGGNPLLIQGRVAVDVLLETPIDSDKSKFRLHPRFGRLGVRVFTTLTFLEPGGGERKFEYEGDPADFWLNPSIGESLRRFAAEGSRTAFGWFDLLLFGLCVTIAMWQTSGRARLGAIFLAAQLVASAWAAPAAIVGILTAAAVVYMGMEAIVGGTGPLSLLVTGAVFGLGSGVQLHPSLQFGGAHSLASALAFNTGIVASEVILMTVLFGTVSLLLNVLSRPTVGTIILSALAIHISWLNLIERAHLLSGLRL